MTNYRKGVMDAVAETALDTEAAHSVADGALDGCQAIDRAMDAQQEKGYAMLRVALTGAADAPTRRAVSAALECLERAEALETEGEAQVRRGKDAVLRARFHNRRVIGLAEANRRACLGRAA